MELNVQFYLSFRVGCVPVFILVDDVGTLLREGDSENDLAPFDCSGCSIGDVYLIVHSFGTSITNDFSVLLTRN